MWAWAPTVTVSLGYGTTRPWCHVLVYRADDELAAALQNGIELLSP